MASKMILILRSTRRVRLEGRAVLIQLFAVLFLDQLGAQLGEDRRHPVERGAHLGLELTVLGAALVEEALGDREARFVTGQGDAKFGALAVEIGAQAPITANQAAGDAGDQHAGLDQVTEIDVGSEVRMQHYEFTTGQ